MEIITKGKTISEFIGDAERTGCLEIMLIQTNHFIPLAEKQLTQWNITTKPALRWIHEKIKQRKENQNENRTRFAPCARR
jgi:hypothetical protein